MELSDLELERINRARRYKGLPQYTRQQAVTVVQSSPQYQSSGFNYYDYLIMDSMLHSHNRSNPVVNNYYSTDSASGRVQAVDPPVSQAPSRDYDDGAGLNTDTSISYSSSSSSDSGSSSSSYDSGSSSSSSDSGGGSSGGD